MRGDRHDTRRHAERIRAATLKPDSFVPTSVNVTCEVVGEETTTVSVADDATYADLCRTVGYSPHEVTVLVDETPVPEDATVETERVTVLRLVKGG